MTPATYDAKGWLASVTDPGGATRSFVYDTFGRLSQVRNDAGTTVEAYAYNFSRTSGSGWVYSSASPNYTVTTTYLQPSARRSPIRGV